MPQFGRRARLLWNRRLSMSNLLENLASTYGDAPALDFSAPRQTFFYSGPGVTFTQALRFTDLAAQALIRDLDLRKGERVLILTPDAGEAFLLAAAVIKSGGVPVPASPPPSPEETDLHAGSCGVTVVLFGEGTCADGNSPSLPRTLPDSSRAAALRFSPRSFCPPGFRVIDLNPEEDFFLPYTLKPSSLAGIFPLKTTGALRCVMATNRALLYPARFWSPLLPVEAGEPCLFCLPLNRPSSFSVATLALCAGLRLRCVTPAAEAEIPSRAGEFRPAALSASADQFLSLTELCHPEDFPISVRLWLIVGRLEKASQDWLREYAERIGKKGRRVFVMEFLTMQETAPLAFFRLSLPGSSPFSSTPFLPLPPHRARMVTRAGIRAAREGEGELALRGPCVTPGFWNDLEGSLQAWRKGWFRTGIPARRKPGQ